MSKLMKNMTCIHKAVLLKQSAISYTSHIKPTFYNILNLKILLSPWNLILL
jgi:hypothetical protein